MKRLCSVLLALSMGLSLIACAGNSNSGKASGAQGEYDNEILTTKTIDQSKTMVTVRIENTLAQNIDLEKILEDKFPNIDFVMVHDGSVSSEYTIRADLEHGTECDLILSRRLNLVDDIAADYLLDLSSEKLLDNYYLSSVDSCMTTDGKVYYLPGPSDVYGIVYDKTLFEEYGWQLPQSYSDFVNLIAAIKEANITVDYTDVDGNAQTETLVPIQPTMMYPDMFQIVFNTYSFDLVYRSTQNYRWLSSYQNGTGSMVGHMEPAVAKYMQLFEDGILSLDDWNVQPVTRSNMMYIYHTTAMIIESQNAVNYSKTFSQKVAGTEYHEIAMMPFWTSDEADSDYVYAIPSYFMAINKKSAEESSDKKQLLLQVYEYLSSAEGQKALIGDSPQISNVRGVDTDSSSFSDAIKDTVAKGQIVNNFYLANGEDSKQVEKQLRSTTPDLIQGNMSVGEWLLAADKVRDEFLEGKNDEGTVYGQSETTLTRLESAYTMAEMYKDLTGADIGICLGGEWRNGTNGYFYEGDITDDSLTCIRPDKESTSDTNPMASTIVVSKMTGAQILEILNCEVDTEGNKDDNVYYVAAGLTVKFDPWADTGKRVISCKTSDGKEINPDDTYTVAYFYGSLPTGSVAPQTSLAQTWLESFTGWLEKNGGVIKKPTMTIELAYGEAK